MSTKLVKTNKNKDKLYHQGFYYYCDKTAEEKRYWHCELRKSLACKARVVSKMKGDVIKVINNAAVHNHFPNPVKLEVIETVYSLKKKAFNSNVKPIQLLRSIKRNMGDEILVNCPSDVALSKLCDLFCFSFIISVVPFFFLAKTTQRMQQKTRGKENVSTVDFILLEQSKFLDGEEFLVEDIKNGEQRAIIFSSYACLRALCSAESLILDGTFKICPNSFKQVYTIHASVLVKGTSRNLNL